MLETAGATCTVKERFGQVARATGQEKKTGYRTSSGTQGAHVTATIP